MLTDLDLLGGTKSVDPKDFMAQTDEFATLLMDGQDTRALPSRVVNAIEKIPRVAVGGYNEQCPVAGNTRDLIGRVGEMLRCARWNLPSEQRGGQVSTADLFRLLGEMGGEVPRLEIGRAEHKESKRALLAPQDLGKVTRFHTELPELSHPPLNRPAMHVHIQLSAVVVVA